jgi:two-component system sensor histidine kinase/response regulator
VLLGDADRVKQVLHNLVGNAVKFTDHGEVVLRVTAEQRLGNEIHLRFAVSDTGIGIPPEKQQLIFEAFAQADASTTRKFGGTGLGLAISSRIVELMGGSMDVVSKVGEGSTFSFVVPMRIAHPAADAQVEAVKADLRGITALIVDDNASSRVVLEEMLSTWGLKVSTAASAGEALSAVTTATQAGKPFRLLLVDGRMPGGDGYDLAAEILRMPFRAAVVMMLTSDDYNESVRRCRAQGINTYLIKPVKQCELLAAIRGALAPEMDIAQVQPRQKQSPSRFRILLAEDNLVNQRLTVRLLEKMGHQVVVAQNGREALEILRGGSFDLVLMDVQMPEMDGFAATQEIRKSEQGQQAHLPVIAMTAHAMKGDREGCMEVGMDGYIAKPINLAELQRVIDEAIKASAAVRG